MVSLVRTHISSLSMMSVRSRALCLLELITDLDCLGLDSLGTDTPLAQLLQPAILDKVYGSSRRRFG